MGRKPRHQRREHYPIDHTPTLTGAHNMKPLKTITQMSAIAGFALTVYGCWLGDLHALEAFALTVFFFWAHVYAHAEIEI
jgi:hypothetical protein